MEVNWKAIVAGFVVALALAVVSGLVVGMNATSLALSWGTIGVVSGLVAGFIAGGTVPTGAVHGGIATVLGSLITLAIVTFTTLLFAGLVPTFGVLVGGVLLLAFYAIPGALGGAIGSWASGRRASRTVAGARA
ncbi:DUF5518 domain-containing protein [Natrinema halophilum]|uniref:DUF5518 domain-containing protein n=1 Tax=Natrinema halophilum TaxID=1699371 RepID=A0A7D5GNS4_9EURY|nr:DUF5518 domain-containing protein [Natrinema halophilum]QLG49633.1 DUF5518 domain-containing protein [Natrinema halophilum]